MLKELPALTELNLCANSRFGDGHAKELAKSAELARVRVLHLGFTDVTAAGVAALVSGRYAPALTVLHLDGQPEYDWEEGIVTGPRIDQEDGGPIVEALVASKALGAIEELSLSYHALDDAAVTRFVGAAQALPALRRLRLNGCTLTLPAVKALADSALGARLLYVNLNDNPNLVKHRAKLKKMFPGAHVEEPFEYVS